MWRNHANADEDVTSVIHPDPDQLADHIAHQNIDGDCRATDKHAYENPYSYCGLAYNYVYPHIDALNYAYSDADVDPRAYAHLYTGAMWRRLQR